MVDHQFFIVRVAPGKESKFLEAAYRLVAKKENHGIFAIFAPELVRGYVFVEADEQRKVVDALRGVPNNLGVLKQPVAFTEISKYLEKESEQIIVHERDIVEIVSGPFKGDKAKVIRIVPGKDEVIIEPLNMPVPIPITLSVSDIRVIKDTPVQGIKGEY